MGKERRKNRLDKGGATEFIGFDAFSGSISTTAVTSSTNTSSPSSSHPWTPYYTGNDRDLHALFPRLLRRDATTKCKALQDLQAYLLLGTSSVSSDTSTPTRPAQSLVLQHYAWLYANHLYYDASGMVRAAALPVWTAASRRLPKVTLTLLQDHVELAGMMYSGQCDPDATVRQAAASAVAVLSSSSTTTTATANNANATAWPWDDGVLALCTRLLSYGRASVLYDSLFAISAKKKQNNSSNSNDGSNNNNKDDQLSEVQREENEERFERLVGTALATLELWIRTSSSEVDTTSNPKYACWFHTLNSPKASLRRSTYQLIATIAQKQQKQADKDDISQQLQQQQVERVIQCLTSEKDAGNIGTLLETILALLSLTTNDTCRYDGELIEKTLYKPLTKLLRKACHGARVDSYGPLLLPLAALYNSDDEDNNSKKMPLLVSLLQAIWQGREYIFGVADQWKLLAALVECCSYCLLRKRRSMNQSLQVNDKDTDAASEQVDTNDYIQSVQSIAQLWLDTLYLALSTAPDSLSGLALQSYTHLLRDHLAKFAVLFQTEGRPDCDFFQIHSWFWQQVRLEEQSCEPLAVAQWVQYMMKQRRVSDGQQPVSASTFLLPSLQLYFSSQLAPFRGGAAVPSKAAYDLFYNVCCYCGANHMFASLRELSHFVVNDLLQWTILHTTTASVAASHVPIEQGKDWIVCDFGLLACTLSALDTDKQRQVSLWETVLKEVVAANCDLQWLAVGLQHLVTQGASWISCEALDQAALEIFAAPRASAARQNDQDLEKQHLLLRVLVGLSDENVSLVTKRVIDAWVDQDCVLSPKAEGNTGPLLEVMLESLQVKKLIQEEDQMDRLLLASWYQGGDIFALKACSVLAGSRSLCTRFLLRGSDLLRQEVDNLMLVSKETLADLQCLAISWSTRAWSLLQVSQSWLNWFDQVSDSEDFSPSLALVHLTSVDNWRKHPKVLYLCTTLVLRHIQLPVARLSVVMKSTTNQGSSLLPVILVATSGASADAAAASLAKACMDRSAVVLDLLFGPLSTSHHEPLDELIQSVVQITAQALKDGDDENARRGVAVLAQLVDKRFPPLESPQLDASSIVAGSRLAYVIDPDNPMRREAVTVTTVHWDAQAGFYFTIKLDRDGEVQERQTVVQRLRKMADPDVKDNAHIASVDSSGSEEKSKRLSLCFTLLQKLVKPFFVSASWKSGVAEVVPLICCHIGLGGPGSESRYLSLAVKEVHDHCCVLLASADEGNAADWIWKLALALGCGLNCRSSDWAVLEIDFDMRPCLRALLLRCEKEIMPTDSNLYCAVLAILSACMGQLAERHASDEESLSSSLATLTCSAAWRVIMHLRNAEFCGEDVLVTNATYHLLSDSRYLVHFASQAPGDLRNIFAALVTRFASRWEDNPPLDGFAFPGPSWSSSSLFTQLVNLGREGSVTRAIFSSATCSDLTITDKLVDALFVPAKRHVAFQLLDYLARGGEPVFELTPLDESTAKLLLEWTDGLQLDEADILKEDVEIVSRFLPRRMMNELTCWGEEIYEETSDSATVARLLIWLCALRYVDVECTPEHYRYRPAFVSYLSKSGAADAALNLALLNDDSISDSKRATGSPLLDVDDLLRDGSLLSLPQLARLVVFRTIEFLPSISRRWWEESCPKVFVEDVQSFVEKFVSPEILKRELGRIRSSVGIFGDMVVSSSSVSRVVKATYIQDDFTLSVKIVLPVTFPFRSAEVDCSETLGVPPERWKRWSLQITRMLSSQGGTLQDALSLWKENVDKEFDGVEPCPVCYSVLHVKTHKLPTLACKTCQNRFHSNCLTEWFRSSGKNQCVICQQPWQGTRV